MTDNTTGWELLSAWPGGAVSSLATTDGPGGHGAAITLAATAAGLHVSRDGGQTWRWIALGPAPVTDALAVSPRIEADRTVLIGTNAGLHRSTDGGLTWRAVLAESRVQCIAATPDFADGGLVLVGTEADGVLRSEDGGHNWDGGSAGLLDLNVTALALSPGFERDRTAFAGAASGLYRSRNSGRAWRLVEIGLEVAAIQALAVSPAFQNNGLVLAGTEQNGLLRSDDGGQTWASVTAFPEPCVTSLTFRPAAGGAPAIIVAGTAAGVVLSRDGGRSWQAEAPDLGPILSLAGTGDAILAGTIDQGVVRRVLGGAEHAAWTPANDGLAGRATVGLAVTLAFGTEPLFGVAMLDGGVLISHDDARSWRTGHNGLTDPAASSLTFVRRPGGQPALLTVYPDGLYWSDQIESGWQRVDLPLSDTAARVTVLSLVSTPATGPSTVLAAGIHTLLLSQDGGETWTPLPLPRPTAEIISVAASPDLARDQTLYASVRATRYQPDGSLGYYGLDLWYTRDLGQHWTRWSQSPEATLMPILAAPAGVLAGDVLIGYPGRVSHPMPGAEEVRGRERRPILVDARVGGPLETVTALAASPTAARDGIVLAAGSGCVYRSTDGGASFAAWDDGLSTPLITGLSVVQLPGGQLEAHALGLGGTLWRRRLP